MHGSEWQRRCLLGRSSQSISEGSSQSGGGGRVKVREITDLLGVSNNLILPPLRSSLREKGLTRAGAARKQEGMSEGRSVGGRPSEGLRSDVRERLRLGSSAALGKTEKNNPGFSTSHEVHSLVFNKELGFFLMFARAFCPFRVSPLTAGSPFCIFSVLFSSSTTITEKDGRTFTFN